jgi:hypothetical protein
MTEEEAQKIGFPREWLPTDLTVEEALIERCDDCNGIIKKHDSAKWRLEIRPIRCAVCISILIDRGFDPFEARFVL